MYKYQCRRSLQVFRLYSGTGSSPLHIKRSAWTQWFFPHMGAASSVGADKAHDRRIADNSESRARYDDKVNYAEEEFDTCARALASKYHDSRLQVGGSSSCKEHDCAAASDSVSIPSPSLLLENDNGKVPMPRSGSLSRSFSPPLPRAERKRLSRQTHTACSFVVDGADAKPRRDPAAVAALSTFLEAEG